MFATGKYNIQQRNNNNRDPPKPAAADAADAAAAPDDAKMVELREAFAFFDKNGDGSIEAEELGAVMRSLGYQATDSELRDMIHEADVDGNEMIDFGEFVQMMETKSRHGQAEDEELREAFKVFDRDGNGFISRSELTHVMQNIGEDLSEDDINEMINEADKNKDGQIDYEEFVDMLGKNDGQSNASEQKRSKLA